MKIKKKVEVKIEKYNSANNFSWNVKFLVVLIFLFFTEVIMLWFLLKFSLFFRKFWDLLCQWRYFNFLNNFRFSFFTLLCPSKIVVLFIFYFRVESIQDSKAFQINKIKLENWNFFDKGTLRLFCLISIWRFKSIIENLHHF